MTEENLLIELKKYISEGSFKLKGPQSADKVYKDECFYCFDTAFSPGGLFISLMDFVGVCAKHLDLYVKKTSFRLFLNIKKSKVPNEDSEEPKDKIQRLCISQTEDKISSDYSLCLHPHIEVPIKIESDIGDKLREIVDMVIAHISAELQQRLQSGVSEWDGEERQISKAAEKLEQIPFEGKISYDDWICAKPGCELKENLWLNLSDGVIMCGRYAPISGVKGNGHAKTHYEETGYPLVVKLGTIADGDGDIYSYSEDAPVRDPLLGKHLAHFGLSIDKFTKTEKTTLELELDANLKHEFYTIQEEGASLKNVYGSGFTGLINLGSSCYINSVLQMLYNVPDFLKVYGENSENLFNKVSPLNSYEDFNCQLAKIVKSLQSGEYSQEGQKENGIRPLVFRRLAGRGHVEFSTAKQQDAEEYIRHLFDKIDNNVKGELNPVDSFRFNLVSRFVDEQSGCVRYVTKEEIILALPVPLEECKESPVQVGGSTRKFVQLQSCLSKAFSQENIDDYVSPVLNTKGTAIQELKMGSFPDFLILQIQRFTHFDNYQIKKLDVDVEMDDSIDLTAFYSDGVNQPGESPFPLMDMGFSQFASLKACIETKNAGLESAANWILQHIDDADLNAPHHSLVEGLMSTRPDVNLKPKKYHPNGQYKLCAFISHMGSSPHSGHYVAHVKRDDGLWYIFNDEKVAISQNPPKSLGYLYLYKRQEPKS
uniref:Ubiquitin carboxyl-terminal hydrolase n=1 Tax=Meloidogyne javanica TaxID=6303 RepID=A0A915MVI8_MELJA